MSEVILYAMDAPRVKSPDAAAKFVEKWQDCTDAPTARMTGFFSRLQEVWPWNGPSPVWYEDGGDTRPGGPLLALAFELSTFDADRLQQLRAMAQQHGLRVFDPEGHVLYLADGTEAKTEAMQVPAPGAATQSPCGVRFDGVYEVQKTSAWSYLCFTADGKIFWQSMAKRCPVRAVMDSFAAADSFVVKGTYKPGEKAFSARLKASFGGFKMAGQLQADGLHVHSERTDGRYPADLVYQFVPLEP
jgi:hypothetical protein